MNIIYNLHTIYNQSTIELNKYKWKSRNETKWKVALFSAPTLWWQTRGLIYIWWSRDINHVRDKSKDHSMQKKWVRLRAPFNIYTDNYARRESEVLNYFFFFFYDIQTRIAASSLCLFILETIWTWYYSALLEEPFETPPQRGTTCISIFIARLVNDLCHLNK